MTEANVEPLTGRSKMARAGWGVLLTALMLKHGITSSVLTDADMDAADAYDIDTDEATGTLLLQPLTAAQRGEEN
jgi:hypothetical protein